MLNVSTTMNALLDIVSAAGLALFLSTAWNRTVFPVVFAQLISRFLPSGWTAGANWRSLGTATSRDRFESVCAALWPFPEKRFGHWMNCAVCNAPLWSAISALIVYPHFSRDALLTFMTCLGVIILTVKNSAAVSPVKADVREVQKLNQESQMQRANALAQGMMQTNKSIGRDPASLAAVEARVQAGQKFLNPDQPCFFGDCETLRTAMQKEISALNPSECSDCNGAKGTIRKFYTDKALEALTRSGMVPPMPQTPSPIIAQ